MKDNFLFKLVLVVSFTMIAIAILLIPTKVNSEAQKVRIDSVTIKLRNPVLPDKMWTYHTKMGSFTTNQEKFNIGDSIPVTTIRVK